MWVGCIVPVVVSHAGCVPVVVSHAGCMPFFLSFLSYYLCAVVSGLCRLQGIVDEGLVDGASQVATSGHEVDQQALVGVPGGRAAGS